ncbi:MAG TPA: PQQ-binding-like beta-propeller repeat protein [Pirellulaceae bacterium]|nr:PQQ-binding-like beta-propeller repeat protein [Pirellulaceae bacterium]HMO91315.1 PQQ-binding-like beta-propeller repeat protein [Pirellulaceae bacterium]HMP70134.1 PQQ-binding-like beta-propeller repeat protein [Pirellulaceae bacterium]
MKTIRIFISSPGDVQEERERARGVVHQLRRRYAGRLELQALLWEELPLQADMSFQQGIDMVLSEKGVDIAVFILWSRLGSPTGPLLTGEQGRIYRSGTEREWDLMLKARERCQREGSPLRPAIIVYTRRDDASFVERLRLRNDEERSREMEQKRLVSQFIQEEFRDSETGTNLRAYHSFDQPTTFAQQLRTHLTHLLDSMVGEELPEPVWNVAENGPPFRGLDAFDFGDASIFFGREDEIVSIRQRLREQACRGKAFVLITGPSGSGKSSLARAGVLPDICRYEIDSEIKQWHWLTIKPNELGMHLLTGLVRALSRKDVLPGLSRWKQDIVPPSDYVSFTEWKARFLLRMQDALGKQKRLLIVVDQLDELFSNPALSDVDRGQFFEVLESLANTGLVWLLATVRSDFYQHVLQIPALVRMKEGAGQFDLLPPTPDALSRVITGPAMLAGLKFEKEGELSLADAILREAVEHRELLPLVEHLLMELCDNRDDDGTLTFAHFRRLGGVEGALRNRCEETYQGLSSQATMALDTVLSELVTLGGDAQDIYVRRSAPIARFSNDPGAIELIDAMVAARLFSTSANFDNTKTAGGGEQVEAGTVSVAHEALLRVWPRCVEWTAANREFLRLRFAVEQSRTRWTASQHDPSLLLTSGLPLEEGRKLMSLGLEKLSPDLRDYIETSISTEEKRLRRTAARRRAVVAVLSIATLVLAALGFTAWHQRNLAVSAFGELSEKSEEVKQEKATAENERDKARDARDKERSAREAAERATSDLQVAQARTQVLLASSLWGEGRVREARIALREVRPEFRNLDWGLLCRLFRGSYATLYGHQDAVVTLDVFENFIVSGSMDATVRMWDANSASLRYVLDFPDAVFSVAFAPDGSQFAVACRIGFIRICDTETGERIRDLPAGFNPALSLSYHPDGNYLVSGHERMITIWNTVDGKKIQSYEGHDDLVRSVAYSPSGNAILTASMDGTIKVWEADTRELKKSWKLEGDHFSSAQFHPDETKFVAGTNNGWIKIYEIDQEEPALRFHQDGGSVSSVSFSPDGRTGLSSLWDGSMTLWDSKTGERLTRWIGHQQSAFNSKFAGSGSRVYSAAEDGTIKFWDVANQQNTFLLSGHLHEITALAFSPNGQKIFSGDKGGEIICREADTGQEIFRLRGHERRITDIRFSPDETNVLTGDERGLVKLWRAEDGVELQSYDNRFAIAESVGFSPDGNRVLAGGGITLTSWDRATGQKLSEDDYEAVDGALAISPDGKTLATTSFDGKLYLLSTNTSEKIWSRVAHDSRVPAIAFSPDGQTIVTGSWDTTAKVWSTQTGELLHTLRGDDEFVEYVAFTADGSRIVTVNRKGPLRIWDAASGQRLMQLPFGTLDRLKVAICPLGKKIIDNSAGRDIRVVLTAPEDEERIVASGEGLIFAKGFTPDGQSIFVHRNNQTFSLWAADPPALIQQQTITRLGRTVNLTFHPNGSEIACELRHDWGARSVTSKLVWNLNTNEVDDVENWPSWADAKSRPQHVSSNGRWQLIPYKSDIVMVDLTLRERASEQALLAAKSRPNPEWHFEKATQATQAEDWFAAVFHWEKVIKDLSGSGRNDDERLREASAAIHHAIENLKNGDGGHFQGSDQ